MSRYIGELHTLDRQENHLEEISGGVIIASDFVRGPPKASNDPKNMIEFIHRSPNKPGELFLAIRSHY